MNNHLEETRSEAIDFINLLLHDVTTAEEELKAQDTSFKRRTYLRTVFAAIEGYIHFLKQSTLKIFADNLELLSEAEVALLKEEQYELNEKGEIQIRRARISTINNLRFALRMFARNPPLIEGTLPKFDLQLSDNNWRILRDALEDIRHRITHPKTLSDLDISDQDLETANKAFSWVHELAWNAYEHATTEAYTFAENTLRVLKPIHEQLLERLTNREFNPLIEEEIQQTLEALNQLSQLPDLPGIEKSQPGPE